MPINLKFWKLFREEKISKQDLRHQRLQQTFDAVGVQVSDATIDALAEDYIAHLSSYTHVFTGTFEVLDYLKDTYRLHIITNGFEAVQERKLKNSNLKPYFDVVVNSEMAGVKKPHPKIFKLALELAQVTPAQALMIGDSLEADILGAQNAGMAAIHFNSNKETDHGHCPIVHQLKKIKELL